jgi:hypothetical protein
MRPTFTPCPFLIGAMAVGVLLAGCEAKLHVTSKPNGDPVVVNVPQSGAPAAPLSISEMCYDGVKYLINQKGGMAAKVSRSPEGNFRLTGC